MKANNRHIGILTESAATAYLAKKGYTIIQRNFRNRFGEIDIIARDKDTYVFIEVKAKTGIAYGHPEDMINPRKIAKIKHMAEVYLDGKVVLCRIDVVAIVLDNSESILRLTHYENV